MSRPAITPQRSPAAPESPGRGGIRTLARHSAVYGVGLILQRVTGFLMVPLYTHYLVPADYGIVELLDLTVWFVGAVAGLGVATALIRFHAKAESEPARREIVSTALIGAIALNGAAALAMCALARPVSTLVLGGPDHAGFVRIAFATFALAATTEIPLTVIRARERAGVYAAASVARLILSLSLNILFVVGLRMGVAGILWSGLITSAVMGATLATLTFRASGFAFSRKRLAEILRFSAPFIGSSLGMFAIHYGDRFFLRWFGRLDDVGVYSLAYKFGFGITFIAQPFVLAWQVSVFPTMAREGGPRSAARLFVLYVALLGWLVLGIGGLAPEVVRILADPAYAGAAAIVPVVAIAYLLRESADFLRLVYLVDGKSSRIGAATLGAALFCVAAYLLLIPRLGMLGAALATALTFAAYFACNVWLLARARPLPVDLAALARPAAAAAAIGIALHATAPPADLPLEPGRVALRVALVASFPLILALLGFFSRDEIAALRERLGRLTRRGAAA